MIALLVLVVLPILFAVAALRWSIDSRDGHVSLTHEVDHRSTHGRLHPARRPAHH